jgi:RNA polymerase sigma factor (sigma-70 family)
MHDAYRHISTERLLRRVAEARAAGDWSTARGEWEACVMRARERVANVVDRYVAKGWIAGADHDDVVQEALVRGGRTLVHNLERLTEASFFAAMVRCADFQCRDDGRKLLRRRRHERSLDEPAGWSGDEPVGRYAREEAREARAAWEREAEQQDFDRRLGDAVARLRDERARRLLTLQRLGADDASIAQELGISVPYVHTMRYRALKELRGLIDL